MIIVDTYKPVPNGHVSRSPYTLFADSQAEVPSTGTATKALISGFKGAIPPTTWLYTKGGGLAVLGTDDNWGWIVEEAE